SPPIDPRGPGSFGSVLRAHAWVAGAHGPPRLQDYMKDRYQGPADSRSALYLSLLDQGPARVSGGSSPGHPAVEGHLSSVARLGFADPPSTPITSSITRPLSADPRSDSVDFSTAYVTGVPVNSPTFTFVPSNPPQGTPTRSCTVLIDLNNDGIPASFSINTY